MAREVIGEALRGVVSRGWRGRIAILVALLLAAAAVLVSNMDIRRIEERWAAQVYAGVNVLSITAAGVDVGGSLDAQRCEDMESIVGVRAAGGVLRMRDVRSASLPGEHFKLVEVTQGYLSVMFPREQRAIVSSTIAGLSVVERLGLSSGSFFAIEGPIVGAVQRLEIDLSSGTPARRNHFDNAVVVSVPASGSTMECIVEADPGGLAALGQAAATWFTPVDVRVSLELPPSALRIDPAADLRSRFSQWVPFGLGVILVSFSVYVCWSRRPEYGVYRSFGLRNQHLALFLAVECALCLWLPVIIGVNIGVMVVASTESSVAAALLLTDVGALLLTVSIQPIVAYGVLSRVNPFEAARGG